MKNAIAILRPTRDGERLQNIDTIRGISLLGVLLINVDLFCGAFFAMQAGAAYPLGWGGGALVFLRRALVEGKAVSLLSLLFGAGMVMQMERAGGRGNRALALRRLGALALIGLGHTFLLWNGDILIDYALLGLAVLPFLKLRAARLFWIIPLLMALAIVATLPLGHLIERVEQNPGWIQGMQQQHFGAGSWLEALRYRAWETVHVMAPLRLQGRLTMCVPFFILGIAFCKMGFFSRPEEHRRKLRLIFILGVTFGLAANLLPDEWVFAAAGGIPFRPLRVLIKLLFVFSKPCLALGYLAGMLLFLRRARKCAAWLAPLGRMALTQYLLQSLACSVVFYGFGFGGFGRIPLNACLLGAGLFFLLQAWSSRLWLGRFHTGPLEWAWRSLAYGTRLPFRRRPQPSGPDGH